MNKQQLEEELHDWKSRAWAWSITLVLTLIMLFCFIQLSFSNYDQGFQDGQANLTSCYLIENGTLHNIPVNVKEYSCEDFGLESELYLQVNVLQIVNKVLEVNISQAGQILKVNCKEGLEFINNETFLGCVRK